MFNDVTFAYPWVLYFLLLIPIMMLWYFIKGRRKTPSVRYSSLDFFSTLKPTLKERLVHLPAIMRAVALMLFIIALARPQTFSTGENVFTEGIDIAIVLDISGSMLAEDLRPNRIDAAKKVIDGFISDRVADRIGLVIFAREAFTQCPLTIDYSVLRNLLKDVKSGMIEDGTAIGNAIANGINRLKDSEAKSKIIILLTDGVNNAGEIDPITAAQIAQTFGIKIYTIGVGTKGEAPYPVKTPFGTRYQMVPVEIDEKMLKEISALTNGRYFRATNTKALESIYNEIDKMERTEIEVTSYRQAKELFAGWLGGGLLLLLIELSLVRSFLRKIP